MNTNIKSYIDHCLLDEYAAKSRHYGYSLDITDLPDNELTNFLDYALKNDPATRELITAHLQELIESRLPLYECEHRYSQGMVPVRDSVNGEVNWIRSRGY